MPPKKGYKKNLVYKTKTEKPINSPFLQTAKWLVIVESPSKCKKIEEYLGNDYCCISSKGHIRRIENLEAIDIHGDYSIKFSIIEEKRGHIKEMLNIISQFNKNAVIIATDDDREGEAIGWHICDLFDLDITSTRRIKFHEITQDALLNAVANPGHIDMDLVRAQHYRQVLDMLVGFKISPVLWENIYKNPDNALSAGRCQTPALKLIYENKLEIDANPIKMLYKIQGRFLGKDFILSKEFETEEEVFAFYKSSLSHKHILSIKPPKLCEKGPPQPFNTSRLLQYASNHLGLSPKDTMRLCQALYQEGHITYMRTDSQKYAGEFLKEVRNYLLKENGSDERIIGEKLSDLGADSKAAHEAIRCCHIEMTSIEGDGATLYRHIWKNTIQSCMSSYKYKSIDLIVSAPLVTSKPIEYHYAIEIPLYMGWMRLERAIDTKDVQEASTFHMTVTTMTGSQNAYQIGYEYLTTIETIKNRTSHYTEAGLIQKLEDLGIGRPSTYAGIVDTLKERGYVKKENIEGKELVIKNYILQKNSIEIEVLESTKRIGKEQNKLIIQFIGQVVADFLYSHYTELFEYGYTSKMETQLDAIANGSQGVRLCEDCHIKINELSKKIEINKWDTTKKRKEYRIDENHVLICEKYGPVLKKTGMDDYIKIKNLSIDLDKLKRGEYTIEELLSSQTGGGETFSNIQRILNDDLSIRLGKYGSYIFYKTKQMRKPEFFKLASFKEPYLICDKGILIEWIYKTYIDKKK